MKRYIALATAATLALACAACTSGPTNPDRQTRPTEARSSTHSVASATTTLPMPSGSARLSRFCATAAAIGMGNLGVSDGNSNPDPRHLLSQIDQLNTLAPSDLRTDFATFVRLEHAVLDPTSNSTTAAPGSGAVTVAAIHHVSTYFRDTCGLG